MVTPGLIVACTAVYVLQLALDGPEGQAFTSRFWVIGGAGFAWYRALTFNFLHGDFMHLAGNMLFLWVFGRAVEDRLGRWWFLLFYLVGGAFSGLVHAWFESAPAIGASGAISAVTGAFLVLFPRTRIKLLWFLILISVFQAPAWFFIGLQVAWNVIATTTGREGNVATLAHLAGYAYGFVIAFVLLWLKVLPREPYDLFSISRHAKRRQEFRAAARVAPRPARPMTKVQAERTEAVAHARAAVSRELSKGRPDAAVEPYRALLAEHGSTPGAATLSRNAQYQLGAHLYAKGETGLAAQAFGDFLAEYPADKEAPQIKVLLGRLLAAEGRGDEARTLLEQAVAELADEGLKAIAHDELEAIAAATTGDEA
ncbi:MAG: rhomboid family intramembrane serine protease [Phycisphaeraceae bacterium]|nr:MAG: rhomboid family intramembrane serine protease [Phycisphaeraceae bacterium]